MTSPLGGPGRHWRLAAGALVISALGVAACGSGTASPPVAHAARSSATTISRTNALHLAGQCIRQHGIPNFPDPTVASFDKRALRAAPSSVANQALTACRTALAQAGISLGGPNPQVTTQQQIQKLLALARCIRSHGVPNFPDPNPTTGDFGRPPGISFPQLLAAARACRPLVNAAGLGMPTPGNPPGSGT